MTEAVRLPTPVAPRACTQVRLQDGESITLRRHGVPNGPRLVLSHGNGLAADAYAPFWSLLADRFDLVLYDFRNHGWNAVGDVGAHTMETFLKDNATVAAAIDHQFGRKPRVGVFHSVSALTALLPGSERLGYTGLVLFDPPLVPSHREKGRVLTIARALAIRARNRPDRFESWRDLAAECRGSRAFTLVQSDAVDHLAYALVRHAVGGLYALRCPREYEARVFEELPRWAARVDLRLLSCPVKVLAGDPLVPFSFIPSADLTSVVELDYDFLPDTTHFLQLEQPAACVERVLQFVESHGLA